MTPITSVQNERRWVIVFAILVMLVTSIPYLLGYALQGEDWQFSGFVFGVEDGNSYIAKMLGGSAGAWLFRTPYTTIPQTGVLAFLPYILLGKLVSPPGVHVQLVAIYHIFRVFAGILLILATYDFLSVYLNDVRLRRFGLALAVAGGGLGWLLVLLGWDLVYGSIPLEFYSPETFGFLNLYGLPHLSLARATFLWGLVVYLRSSEPVSRANFHESLKLGGLWLLTALTQPLTAVVMGLVIGLHIIVLGLWNAWLSNTGDLANWQDWFHALQLVILAGFIPAPFILYNYLSFSNDPFLSAWTAQNIITSPHPIHYILAYGLCLPFMVPGAIRLLRDRPWVGWLPIAWVIVIPFLAYAPFNLQRRLPDGVWVAIVMLTMFAFESKEADERDPPILFTNTRNFYRYRFILFFAFPSTLLLLAGGLFTVRQIAQPVFQPGREVAAFRFIEEAANSNDIVLAAYETGNALPAWAPVRVVIGHGPESIGLTELSARVEEFYQTNHPDSIKKNLLSDLSVRFVFWGPAERALGGWDPHKADFLREIFNDDGYAVFDVVYTHDNYE